MSSLQGLIQVLIIFLIPLDFCSSALVPRRSKNVAENVAENNGTKKSSDGAVLTDSQKDLSSQSKVSRKQDGI